MLNILGGSWFWALPELRTVARKSSLGGLYVCAGGLDVCALGA